MGKKASECKIKRILKKSIGFTWMLWGKKRKRKIAENKNK